jgi:hypothetical protein
MSGIPKNLVAAAQRFRQALTGPGPQSHHVGLAQRIATIADDLAAAIDDAAELGLIPPTAVTNAVLDLRAWSARAFDDSTARRTAIDATALLTYVRTLRDRQLLALLADLPWPRLDALLDAVNDAPTGRPLVQPARSNGRSDAPHRPA